MNGALNANHAVVELLEERRRDGYFLAGSRGFGETVADEGGGDGDVVADIFIPGEISGQRGLHFSKTGGVLGSVRLTIVVRVPQEVAAAFDIAAEDGGFGLGHLVGDVQQMAEFGGFIADVGDLSAQRKKTPKRGSREHSDAQNEGDVAQDNFSPQSHEVSASCRVS